MAEENHLVPEVNDPLISTTSSEGSSGVGSSGMGHYFTIYRWGLSSFVECWLASKINANG